MPSDRKKPSKSNVKNRTTKKKAKPVERESEEGTETISTLKETNDSNARRIPADPRSDYM